MNSVKDHPTWKMLEKAKQDFKLMTYKIPTFHPLYKVVIQANNSIINLQYELENKLLKEMSGED